MRRSSSTRNRGDSVRTKKLKSKSDVKIDKIVKSYAVRTRRGKNGGIEKTNQDSFVACYGVKGNTKNHMFGVYDGHGKT